MRCAVFVDAQGLQGLKQTFLSVDIGQRLTQAVQSLQMLKAWKGLGKPTCQWTLVGG